MADQQATPEPDAEPAKSGGSMMGKLIIAGFMGLVVAVECLLAYLFIPSADEVAALAEQNMAKKLPAAMAGEDAAKPAEDTTSMIEKDLGEFTITVSQPNSNLALRVDFHLYGTVEDKDEKELATLLERTENRFRDQILFEIRNSEPEDLGDPALGLIKRRILEKSNALFGKPILRSVVFSQFSYVEQ